MVYIYVCKRFKNSMEMVTGRDGEWVNNVLQFYCKHLKLTAKLERAEINPKKGRNILVCWPHLFGDFHNSLIFYCIG